MLRARLALSDARCEWRTCDPVRVRVYIRCEFRIASSIGKSTAVLAAGKDLAISCQLSARAARSDRCSGGPANRTIAGGEVRVLLRSLNYAFKGNRERFGRSEDGRWVLVE